MIGSSLAESLKEAGIPVGRGTVVVRREPGEVPDTPTQYGSDLWLYRWARNSHRNYPVISRGKGIQSLQDSCAGWPAIVVGIGPSLDDQIADLKKAVGKAVIIATDAAFRPLMANGIKPNLVVSYDCKAEQRFLWDSVGDHDVPCLFDSCAHPDSIAAWRGPVLFFNHWHHTDEFSRIILPQVYPHIGQAPSAGTVGNISILLSKLLGCNPTIAVGMDLCYARAGDGWRYRAKDYIQVAPGKWLTTELKTLYDNSERVARSSSVIDNGQEFRIDPELGFYFETLVKLAKHFKVELLNVSPEGRLKYAFTTTTLDEAVELFCEQTGDPLAAIRTFSDPRIA